MIPPGPPPPDPRSGPQPGGVPPGGVPPWGGAPTPDSWVTGSHHGSQAGSQGSQAGSQYGSQAGSHYGSQAGSHYGSQAGSQAGSHYGSQAGSHHGSQAPGSRASGSWAPGVPLHSASQTGSQAGPRRLVSDEGAVFQLESELGRGGMGVVYQAYDERLGRPVALKIGLARDTEKRLKRFLREGEIAASLEHPGIVRVHSSGSIGGRPYLCFELVAAASTLHDSILSLPVEDRLRLVVELGEALGFAHAKGVVHRDVKPENVLIDGGHARLTDFGVALGADQERLTNTGTTLGTPYYAAPEQLRDGHRVGPPADVWSLGVILYQALTGELPFNGENLLSLVAQISSGFFEPPRQLAETISPALEAVCLKALQIEVEDRYASGTEFAADLGRAIRGEETEALVRGGVPWGRVLAGVLLLAAVVAGVALAFANKPGAGVPSASPSSSAAPTPDRAPDWIAEAEKALASRQPNLALAALKDAPAQLPVAVTLRARARLQLYEGAEALADLKLLPAGAARSVLALQAIVHGADPKAAEELLAGPAAAPDAPEVLRWRFLVAAAEPAPHEDLQRALRKIRRAKVDTEALRGVAELYTKLKGLDWPEDGLWTLAEDSPHDKRLPQAQAEFETALALFERGDPQGVAFRLGLQRWLVPRLRFTLARLDTRRWRGVAIAGLRLEPSPEADEIQLLLTTSLTINSDAILPSPLSEAERVKLSFSEARLRALPSRARFLWALIRLIRVQTLNTGAPERLRLLLEASSLLPPLPPDGAPWSPNDAQTQEIEALKTGFMIEASRLWREAWEAPTQAGREAKLSAYDALMAEVKERVPAEGIAGDWRHRATSLRVAILRHDLDGMLDAVQGGWNDAGHDPFRHSVLIEGYLARGELEAAREEMVAFRKNGIPAKWAGLVHNQSIFLKDPPEGTPRKAVAFQTGHPFPWYSEAGTKRLLEAGWKPGEALLPALGRK